MEIPSQLSIPEKWKEVEHESMEAAEDFRVFCIAAKETAAKLKNYRFFIDNSSDKNNEITNHKALSRKYNLTLENVKKEIVCKLQRSGQDLNSFDQYLMQSSNDNEQKTRLNYAKLTAWNKLKGQFLELVCLLSILSRVESPKSVHTVHSIFSQIGPLQIIEEGNAKNLWTQKTFSDTNSGLKARPDIIMTSPEQYVTAENILSIVECKCVKKLTSGTIRAEFGKAHDLRVNSYAIVSYYNPGQKIVNGAKKFGIDVVPFKLHTKEREFYINNPAQLVESLSEDLLDSRKKKNFLSLLENAADASRRKSLQLQ